MSYLKIEDTNMLDGDSKDKRGKPKEHLLDWVRKKTGYVYFCIHKHSS
jgi:hypothetical protein